jgi:hypothetical protein
VACTATILIIPNFPTKELSNDNHVMKLSTIVTDVSENHTSPATQNYCAYGKINAYFQTGALPGSDSFCNLENGPWGILPNATALKKGELNDIQGRLKNLIPAKI